MNVIIIESKAYSVSKAELKKIQQMQQKLQNEKNFKTICDLEMELSNYLSDKTERGVYKCLGHILFDFRL